VSRDYNSVVATAPGEDREGILSCRRGTNNGGLCVRVVAVLQRSEGTRKSEEILGGFSTWAV
jgi:hypothetical protein